MIRPTCQTCRHFKQLEGSDGECRAHVPSVLTIPATEKISGRAMVQKVSYWPPVNENLWCGEHQPRIHFAEPRTVGNRHD